jgi:hypothetical protein
MAAPDPSDLIRGMFAPRESDWLLETRDVVNSVNDLNDPQDAPAFSLYNDPEAIALDHEFYPYYAREQVRDLTSAAKRARQDETARTGQLPEGPEIPGRFLPGVPVNGVRLYPDSDQEVQLPYDRPPDEENNNEYLAAYYRGVETYEPATISLAPTQTSNPDRPRTVAAGYDYTRKVLTLVFRDDTYYNYYDVVASDWRDFIKAPSKGQWLLNSGVEGHRHGPANSPQISVGVRAAIHRVLRQQQQHTGGKRKDSYIRETVRQSKATSTPKGAQGKNTTTKGRNSTSKGKATR